MNPGNAKANGLTVMVVDDNPLMRRIVQITLRRHGFNVLLAEDGSTALAALTGTTIDLALIDVVLPKVDGVQVSLQMLQIAPQMRILFTSGYSFQQLSTRGYLIEEANFVSKPTAPLLLVERINQALVPNLS